MNWIKLGNINELTAWKLDSNEYPRDFFQVTNDDSPPQTSKVHHSLVSLLNLNGISVLDAKDFENKIRHV